MLKTKFGMTKVLVLVLSVLMLVSLAACNKTEGPSADDMNAIVQSALAEQSKAQAEQDAAAQSSLKAEQDALASANAALQSSLKAEQDALASKNAALQSSLNAVSSQAATTTKAPATTTQTTTKAPATTAPAAKEDISAQVQELSTLKTKYTYTDRDLYLDAGYAQLVLLFDKATVDLANANTVAAAKAILETLKVDVAAVENVKTAAASVQALIADLGDIETEVFLAQAEKITAARKAYTALKAKYNVYLKASDKGVDVNVAETTKIATKLGINVADLVKAENKADALEDYITETLQADMAIIYAADSRMKYDAEDDANEPYVVAIKRAYYKYLVLNVLNGGDTAAANLEIDWEYKIDKETGKKTDKFDYDKPIAWFTVETLVNNYILPTLDYEFVGIKEAAVAKLAANLNNAKYESIKTAVSSVPGVVAWSDVDDIFEDVVDAFEAELETLSFVADYKSNKTMSDATADIYTRYMKSYVAAVNGYIALAQEAAIDAYTDTYDAKVKALEAQYADDKYETILANKLAAEKTTLDTFIANVKAAPSYDFDAINAEDVRVAHSADKKNPYKALTKYIDVTTDAIVADTFYTYVDKVITTAIKDNFKTRVATAGEDGVLETVKLVLLQDLEILANELDATEEGKLYLAYRGAAGTAHLEGTYAKEAAVAAVLATVNAAIDKIEAIAVENYTDKAQAIKHAKATSGDFKSWSEKALYFVDAAAYDYAVKNYKNEDGSWNEAELNKSANKKVLLTATATDYALTYNYTATEQAAKAAYDAYLAAMKDVHAQLLALAGVEAAEIKKVTGTDAYKAITSAVASDATLSKEVSDLAAVYTMAITDLTALKNTVAEPSVVSTNFEITKTHVTIKTLDTAYELTVADAYVKAAADKFSALVEKMDAKVDEFDAIFYTDSTKKASNVVELWKYKNEKVQAITSALTSYQNKYATDDKGVMTQTNATAGYAYAGVEAGVKLAKATSYEDALNKLIADYTASIMGVKLNTTKVEVKTAIKGTVITSKDGTATAGLANAKTIVDAYVTKLLGDGNSYTVNGTAYANADSAAFQAYKLYILVNYDALA